MFYFNSFFQKFFRKFLSELFQLHISPFKFEINCICVIIPYYSILFNYIISQSMNLIIIIIYNYALILLCITFISLIISRSRSSLEPKIFKNTFVFTIHIGQCLPLPQSKSRYYLVEVTFSETRYIRE